MPDEGALTKKLMGAGGPANEPLDEGSVVRLATGAELFVRVVRGPHATGVPVLLNDGLGCDGYVWRHLISWLRPRHPIIHWNYRGHGDSPTPPVVQALTLDVVMDDLFAVLDHVEVERAAVLGHSMGVQVSLEAYRRRPDRVAALGLLFGSWERPVDSWHGAYDPRVRTPSNLAMRAAFWPLSRVMRRAGHRIAPLWRLALSTPIAYEVATHLEVDGERVAWRDFGPYLSTLGRMDPRVFFQLARELAVHSADEVLERVGVPTLVVGGTRDTFTPGWRSEAMARRIPGAELCLIEGASHTGPIEHPTLVGSKVLGLLARCGEAGPRGGGRGRTTAA